MILQVVSQIDIADRKKVIIGILVIAQGVSQIDITDRKKVIQAFTWANFKGSASN